MRTHICMTPRKATGVVPSPDRAKGPSTIWGMKCLRNQLYRRCHNTYTQSAISRERLQPTFSYNYILSYLQFIRIQIQLNLLGLSFSWCVWRSSGAFGGLAVRLAVQWCVWRSSGAFGGPAVRLAVQGCVWRFNLGLSLDL